MRPVAALGLALALSGLSFAWGAATIRHQVFPYALISAAVRGGWLPGAVSRSAQGLTATDARLRGFALARREVDIVMAGDSRVAGFDWQEALPDRRVANRGVNGTTVAAMRRYSAEIARQSPALVYLMAGINDLALGAEPAQVLAEIEALRAALAEPGRTIVVMTALSCRGPDCPQAGLDSLNAALRTWAAETGTGLLDLAPAFADDTGALQAGLTYDGVHLDAAGYALWLDLLRADIAARLGPAR